MEEALAKEVVKAMEKVGHMGVAMLVVVEGEVEEEKVVVQEVLLVDMEEVLVKEVVEGMVKVEHMGVVMPMVVEEAVVVVQVELVVVMVVAKF